MFLLPCAFLFGGWIGESLWASPMESADSSGVSNSQEHILDMIPPLQFSVDNRMKQNVEFWVRIYSKYNSSQGLIHDAKYIDHVYEVLDLGSAGGSTSRQVRDAKKKWRNILVSLHHKQKNLEKMPENLSDEEKKVFQMFQDINEPNKFMSATHRKRLRFQLGQRDNFLSGLRDSGRYLPVMEEVFKKEGLPIELTRLPFVESSFNLRARSKVGASGIWQFMRSTGKLFLRINDAVDERNDPIRAAEAAAKLLRLNYESLRSWPLAVTAYNHGRKGMMRAVRKVGSEELEDLVTDYRSRSFGFASSNFFTELLAAIEVEKNAEIYFGKLERARPYSYVEVRIPDYIDIREITRFLKLDLPVLRELNPALSDAVFTGERLVPAGYVLRLPYSGDDRINRDATLRVFTAGYEEIPSVYKMKAQKSVRIKKQRRTISEARSR